MAGGLQVLLGLWLMFGICSLCVLVLHETLIVHVLMYGGDNDMEVVVV